MSNRCIGYSLVEKYDQGLCSLNKNENDWEIQHLSFIYDIIGVEWSDTFSLRSIPDFTYFVD